MSDRRYCGRRRSLGLARGMIVRRRTLHSRLYSESGVGGRGRGDGYSVNINDDVFDPEKASVNG